MKFELSSSIILIFGLLLIVCATNVNGDVYLQSFPGSNNRLDEANRDRNNADRLFDSQNNNRGGYNVQSFQFISGSIVELQWTNQHGCGKGNGVDCQIILQFMCDPLLRDGTTTETIPNSPEFDANPEYGRQESYDWYHKCQLRERNKGLFTASQNLQKDRAQYTRQNPNGNRRGYECPEERDYYPYWYPSPWIDIAILTDRTDLCPWIQAESQNVKAKWFCDINTTATGNFIPVTAEGCAALRGNWTKVEPWGFPAPECLPAPWTRENHLGNEAGTMQQATYAWRVPNMASRMMYSDRCALRIRYNISSNDYDGWDPNVNASLNDRQGLKLGLTQRFKSDNPYPFKNNPEVDIGNGVTLELAINTAQIGRTFQDRSHRFSILPPLNPADLPCPSSTIYNLVVQGKRGNIVQTFPGTEYFFVPEVLKAKTCDLVHIQWSGSNTNPNNNDGQGQNGSDRHNMMETDENDMGRVLPAHIANATLFNITRPFAQVFGLFKNSADGHYLSLTDPAQHGGEMSELDDAGTYFDGGLFVLTQTGTKHYMNSRNNNFSNRQQKGKVVIEQGPTPVNYGFIVGMTMLAVAVTIILTAGAIAAYQHHNKPAPAETPSTPV